MTINWDDVKHINDNKISPTPPNSASGRIKWDNVKHTSEKSEAKPVEKKTISPKPQEKPSLLSRAVGTIERFSEASKDPFTKVGERAGTFLADKINSLFGVTPEQTKATQDIINMPKLQRKGSVSPTTQKVADTAGNIAGSIVGIGATGKAATAAAKLIPKLSPRLANIAGQAGTGAIYEGANAIGNGGGPVDALKKAGEGALLFGAAGPLGGVVGNKVKQLLPGAAGHYVGNLARGATMGAGFSYGGNLLEGQSLDKGEAAKNAAIFSALDLILGGKAKINRPIPTPEPQPRVPDSEVYFGDKYGTVRTPDSPVALLNAGPSFKTNRYSMEPFIQKQAEQSRQAYDEGITAIQNEYGHWDLRPQDVLPTAQKAGVNLEELFAGLQRAENPLTTRETLGNIANRSRMERVVGLKSVPNISKPERLGYYGVQNGAVMQNKGLTRPLPTIPTDKGVKLAPQLPRADIQPNILPKLPKANMGANGGQTITPEGINPKELKDISGFQAYSTDVYRNFENVYGKKFPEIKKQILDPLDASKKDYIGFQKNWTDKLKTEVVEKLGITKGSKLSGLIQRYGEGGRKYYDKKKDEMVLEAYSLDDLKRDAPNDWQKVVEADKWFRKAYDGLIDEVNVARKQIYPNNPDRIIPKRKDYYRHFQELEGLGGIKNIFETPANIDPNLVAVSEFTQPKSKFLGIAQKRGLGPYKEDAVGGFLNYIPSAAYAINIDKNIRNFAKLAGDLSKGTKDSKNLNNFINFLRKYSQDLAGKTNPIDRVVQEAIPGGRATFKAVRWLNSRVKANVVLGNAASAIAQLANVPQGVAFAKQYSAEGLVRALKSVVPSANNPMNQSGFLAERFGGPGSSMYRQFDTRLIDQPKKMAAWVLETADKLGTNFIWNSAYSKAVREKIANPIKYADENTRKLVAGRGVGEIPLLQKSQITQVILPFTLEVANLWKVQKDFIKGKDFTGLAVLYVANFLFNKVAEETRGSGVTFDPIQASLDAFPELKPLAGQEVTAKEQDMSPLQRGGRLAGEALSNVPAGQYLASAYPEFGTEVFGKQLPTRKELFGRNDPTRFGTGLALVKGIQDPLYKLALPFGGGQLQKTKKGLGALQSQGVYSEDGTKLKYPIDVNNSNTAKGLLFGPGGFKETQPYYENDRRPLSEKQTLQLQGGSSQGVDQKKLYNQVLLERAIDGIKLKISEAQKNPKLSDEEKLRQINELILQGRDLLQKYKGGD